MYDHKSIEKKWQEEWKKASLNEARDDDARPKKYILDMFPYPSGAGLHAGHVESYTATDIYSRYLRFKDFSVLHPQGFDAFGLPAENYAIKTGVHPAETTSQAIANFIKQIDSLGFSYDWKRMVSTCDPEYYRFTQWMFLLMYKNGLAYKKKAKVNWCDSCQTVLANEQAEGGVCERCGNPVIQKDLEQWFFKITDFVEDQEYEGRKISGLLSGLDLLDWPSSTKAAQKNWIGRSEGVEVIFRLDLDQPIDDVQDITVFTTRVDTIFGCTYIVLAPESKLVSQLKGLVANRQEVEEYIEQCRLKTDLQRTELNKDKTGVKMQGIGAINPFNNERVDVYIADYVLASYGTGAVMAVPAHDERDFAFAKKYGLSIRNSIVSERGEEAASDVVYVEDGFLVDSGEFSGLGSSEARDAMAAFLEEIGAGKRRINYRLRDWLVSRQRYWGAPIPVVYCESCGEQAVPEDQLPIKLPEDVDFRPTGESPLKYSRAFNEGVTCPKCGAPAKRESDTMDTFVCSSWYYLRYADPHNSEEFASAEKLKRWLPVDLYMGGAEHTVLHLLYARFFAKVLKKYGYIEFDEPFAKLRHQGIILGEDGNKMSKSKGNVINPDDLVEEYGADTLRIYEMFMGPLEDMKPWNSQGISGVRRFLDRVYAINGDFSLEDDKDVASLLHKTIKKVGEDIESLKYNTAISALMIFVNALYEKKHSSSSWPITKESFQDFLVILAVFAPHIAEDLWHILGNDESIFKVSWPKYDESLLVSENFELAIQVNGKLRGTSIVPSDISEDEALATAIANPSAAKWIEGKKVVKKIYVSGRLINIVVV